jgi:hypothetical protein
MHTHTHTYMHMTGCIKCSTHVTSLSIKACFWTAFRANDTSEWAMGCALVFQ